MISSIGSLVDRDPAVTLNGRTCPMTSSMLAVTGRAVMSVRGTMISCSRRSPNSDDGADHLFLFGLEDPVSPPRSTISFKLLRADLRLPGDVCAEEARDLAGQPGEKAHQRPPDPAEHVDRPGQAPGPLGPAGQGQRLGHELAHDDREQRQQDRDDHHGEAEGMIPRTGTPAKDAASRSARLTAAYAEARKPTKSPRSGPRRGIGPDRPPAA